VLADLQGKEEGRTMATETTQAQAAAHGLMTSDSVRLRADRETMLAGAALVAVTIAAWSGVLAQAGLLGTGSTGGMATDAGGMSMTTPLLDLAGALTFVVAWTVMMGAMMLPSATPLVLLYHTAARGQALVGRTLRRSLDTLLLVAGYLLVWGAFGVPVYLAQQALTWMANLDATFAGYQPFGIAAVLALAGLYQFSPLKRVCLQQCRSPLAFLMQRWRRGASGALRLGVEHGSYCIGCCWGLMVVLMAAGAMGLPWVAAIALVVFAEKLLPGGERSARLIGVLLLSLGALVLLRPDMTMLLHAPTM
jgi:predicted metal-binding membrane protein